MTIVPMPGHAYVPGQTERHAEDAFDSLRRTAVPGQTVAELARSDAFNAGLHYLDTGFYWESHEVLEPVWMALPIDSDERRLVQSLIQLANGRLKLNMGRPKAALRLVGQARALISTQLSGDVPSTAADTVIMSLNVQDVSLWIDALEADTFLAM